MISKLTLNRHLHRHINSFRHQQGRASGPILGPGCVHRCLSCSSLSAGVNFSSSGRRPSTSNKPIIVAGHSHHLLRHHHHHQRHTDRFTASVSVRHFHNDSFVTLNRNGPIQISREVHDALRAEFPVVALESTIITHGMSFPDNLNTARRVEQIVRENGAIPATIGIVDGVPIVGLQNDQLESLATSGKGVLKVSKADLSLVCSSGQSGGTTVSATAHLATECKIPLFVTGGIGGVHRGAEQTMDISADLIELGRNPIGIVCAGIKSILDIEKSLEVLETQSVGVTVIGSPNPNTGRYRFPAFFTADSGFEVPFGFRTTSDAAKALFVRREMMIQSALLFAVPNDSSAEEEDDFADKVNRALAEAETEMRSQKIVGKAVTPFLLSRIAELTSGSSAQLNRRLIENNARIGAEIACKYAEIKRKHSETNGTSRLRSNGYGTKHSETSSSSSMNSDESSAAGNSTVRKPKMLGQQSPSVSPSASPPSSSSSFPIVVIGGSIFDIVAKADEKETNLKLDGCTHPGTVKMSLGGVGRNVADAISRLGKQCLLITAVGDDDAGRAAMRTHPNLLTSGFRILEDMPTSACSVTIDKIGECRLVLGDLRAHRFVDSDWIAKFEPEIVHSPIVILDGNLTPKTMDSVLNICLRNRIPVWYESTDPTLSSKILSKEVTNESLKALKWMSPNILELEQLYTHFYGRPTESPERLLEYSVELSEKILQRLPALHGLLVTLGDQGLVFVGRQNIDFDSPIHFGPESSLFAVEKDDPSQKGSFKYLHLKQNSIASIVNVSGAGDCLVAGTVWALVNGASLRKALEIGLEAAKKSVLSEDPVPGTVSEISSENIVH